MARSVNLFLLTVLISTYFLFDSVGMGLNPIPYNYVAFMIYFFLIIRLIICRFWSIEKMVFMLALLFASVVSSYWSGAPSAIMYSLPAFMLVILYDGSRLNGSDKMSALYANRIAIFLITAGVATLPFLLLNGEARKVLPWIGNPNYTSIFYLGWFVSLLHVARHVSIETLSIFGRYFGVFSIILVAIMTDARSLILAIFVYFFVENFFRLGNIKIQRYFVLMLLGLSVVSQLVLYELFEVFGVTQGRSGTVLNIFDESNFLRSEAFYNSFRLVLGNPDFIFGGVGGADNVVKVHGDFLDRVPHNWFMIMLISDGMVFTGVFFLVLMRAAFLLDERHLPAFSAILVLATITGRAPFFAPLSLYVLCALFVMRRPNLYFVTQSFNHDRAFR
jgi:hypothetical protein